MSFNKDKENDNILIIGLNNFKIINSKLPSDKITKIIKILNNSGSFIFACITKYNKSMMTKSIYHDFSLFRSFFKNNIEIKLTHQQMIKGVNKFIKIEIVNERIKTIFEMFNQRHGRYSEIMFALSIDEEHFELIKELCLLIQKSNSKLVASNIFLSNRDQFINLELN
jgi:hypothetical protein